MTPSTASGGAAASPGEGLPATGGAAAFAPRGPWRKPAFWTAFALVSAACLALALKLFPVALPIVNVDISMSRDAAVAAARERAAALKLASPDARAAVLFQTDGATQNYIELEGGGKKAFGELVKGDLYAPYVWVVRLFEVGKIPEVTLRFTPQGKPYGFERRVAETYVRDPATKALPVDAARALAEKRAGEDWGVDFGTWKFLEQSEVTRPSGRIDRVFVYQRAETLGEARVRLRLATAGDELVEAVRYTFIPQSFARRFAEMRSTNDTIANVATLFAALAYGIGGLIVGTIWLARRKALLPRPSFSAGAVVGTLLGAMILAAVGSAWFGFDTAQSEAAFWAQQVGGAIAITLAGAAGYGLVFMCAEALTRTAFGHQPQLWRLWSREGGATRQALGRTLGGYLFVPIELAFIAVFYYATNTWLGWWQPSSEMTDPNVLSSAVPALGPIAMALQAGFMEECLFRAIPLALGALVGQRFGHRRLGIAIMFVVQAVVFGAAHANYPGFPAYSRLVELIFPAMVWAAIFLRFGLLPTIILHAVFDLVLMSIPVFLVDAPGAGLQRGLVIAAGLVPLAVVLLRRWQQGAWRELPAALRNAGWLRPAEASADAEDAIVAPGPTPRALRFARTLPWLGIAGLAAWLLTSAFRADVPTLAIPRADALARADAAVAARGGAPDAGWKRSWSVALPTDDGAQWLMHRFVWQESGADAYRALIGHTLPPPLWAVRYARFDGDVAARAEEWRVTVAGDGSLRQVRHSLPEAQAGARLSRDAALDIAKAELRDHMGLDPAALTLVAASDTARPNRTDWTFEWTDPRVKLAAGGEARVQVTVGGDRVLAAGQRVHVPEQWLRDEAASDNRWAIAKKAVAILAAIAGLAALVLGVRSFTHAQSDTRAGFVFGLAWFAGTLLAALNSWPEIAFGLVTTDPVATQVALRVAGVVLGALFGALFVGLFAAVGVHAARRQVSAPLLPGFASWKAGAAAALMVAGLSTLLSEGAPQLAPRWPALGSQATWLPWLNAMLTGVTYLRTVAIALFVLFVLQRITARWTRRVFLVPLLLLLLYALPALGAPDMPAALAGGLISGLIATTVVMWLFRYDPRALPAFVLVGGLVDGAVATAQKGLPSAWIGYALGALVWVLLCAAITRYLARPLPAAMPAAFGAAEPASAASGAAEPAPAASGAAEPAPAAPAP